MNKRNKSWRIGRLNLTIDPLLLLIVVLLAWLLSDRYYPRIVYVKSAYDYWIMGVATSLALTLSILVHEFGHAFTAYEFKLPIERIHLFLFGGMAELRHRPIKPYQEFFIALSGPVVSILFAIIFYAVAILFEEHEIQTFYVLQNIGLMNALLGVFNLIPIYPLDGGRALRALIWWWKKRFYRASRITYKIGKQIIGVLFLAAIVLYLFSQVAIAFWMGIFGLYMAYTIMSGRKELNYVPSFNDLILSIDNDDTSPATIIKKIINANEAYLSKSIIPILDEARIQNIIYGEEISKNEYENDTFQDLIKPAVPGTYMETNNIHTFDKELLFKAEYLPVFRGGTFQGMCDAHEMRFWLLDKYAPELFD